MAEASTKEDLKILRKEIRADIRSAVDDLSGVINTFATQVDERFNQLEARVDRIEENINRLVNTIDGFVKRLEDHEVEYKARDHEVARLTRWIEQIAKETGIQLK